MGDHFRHPIGNSHHELPRTNLPVQHLGQLLPQTEDIFRILERHPPGIGHPQLAPMLLQ